MYYGYDLRIHARLDLESAIIRVVIDNSPPGLSSGKIAKILGKSRCWVTPICRKLYQNRILRKTKPNSDRYFIL